MSDESARTSSDANAPANRRLSGWTVLAILAVAIGLGLRIAKAWLGRYTPNPDWEIGALMTRHMVQGVDFPVFFYGQPYMGSVEGVLSALMCRLTGLAVTGFMVNLGTVLVGILLLPVLYVFGRDAGSRRAGFMAVLYCTVGADTFFHYAVSSRLAYMTLLTCGLFTVWMACRIAARPAAAGDAPRRWYLGLGLAAGVGWWGHQLIVVFFIAAAAVLLLRFRWRLLRRGVVYALAGFIIGGLPWWWWNAGHDWGTFDFGNALGKVPFREGLASFWEQFLYIVEVWPMRDPLNAVRLALLALAAVVFAAVLVRDRRRDRADERFWFRLTIPVMLAALALVYATSNYARIHTGRYLLPAVPAVALLVGVGCDRLPRLRRLPWEWAVLAALIPPHVFHLDRMGEDVAMDRSAWLTARTLADAVAPLCDDGVCIGNYMQHWLNFASDERLCVASAPNERYAPYAKRAELAKRPAFLGQHRDLAGFLGATAATSSFRVMAGLRVDYGLTPPPNAWDYTATGLVASVHDGQGRSLGARLQNGIVEDGWSADASRKAPANLTIEFTQPRPVCGLRLLSADERYPQVVRVEGQADAAAPWTRLIPDTEFTDYLWSGPYPKLGLFQYHEELRWSAPTGGVLRLRITCMPDRRTETAPVSLGEVLVMERAAAPDGALPTAEAVARLLRERGAGQAYAPRWLADALTVRTDKTCHVAAPRVFDRGVQDLPEKDSGRPLPVVLGTPTALIMDCRDAPRSRAVLAAHGVAWQETPIGNCTLLFVPVPPAGNDTARFPELGWTETGCYGLESVTYAKRKAQTLYEEGEARLKQGAADRARESFARALVAYPAHQAARRALAQALAVDGRNEAADREHAMLAEQTVPRCPVRVRFSGGIEFLGVSLSTQRVERGRTVDVAGYWCCPPSVRLEQLTAFMHILRTEKPCFQDDHRLLAGIASDEFQCQPYEGEVFVEHRTLTVPADAEPGVYGIRFGLVNRRSGYRLQPWTWLSQRRRAVTLPLTLEVVP